MFITPKRKHETSVVVPLKKHKGLANTVDIHEEDMPATQVDFLDSTRLDDSFGEQVLSYTLTVFGAEDITCYVADKKEEIHCEWSDEPLAIGRGKFLKLPDEHKNRISRKQFEIHCCVNDDTDENEFWIVDFSANGIMIDGELSNGGKKTLLCDGSAIGVLLSPAKDSILIGYSFAIKRDGGKETHSSTKATNSHGKIGKLKAIPKATTNTKTGALGTAEIKKTKADTTNKEKGKGVFAIPAPPKPRATTQSHLLIKPKSGFMHGIRFSLVGYDDATLSDPKKKKLIQDICDNGATYIQQPAPDTVDIVVLNRHYFKEPANYNVNLPLLTSSLHIRFISNTRWLEDCLRNNRKLDLHSEILPPNSGGVVVLDSKNGATDAKKGTHKIDPRLVSQLASMLREEKKLVGAKWKIMAPLATIAGCAGVLEGLEGVVEVLKREKKGEESGDLDFMYGICEAHAAGYRHTLLLLNQANDSNGRNMENVAQVVTVVDATGLISFSQKLHAQRNKL